MKKLAIGANHWRWYGKRVTYTRHVDFLRRWVKEKNTLQIGARDGLIVGKLGISGVDDNIYAIELARKMGVKVDYANSRLLPYKNEQFDSVLMADSILSYKNLALALSETKRIIKKYLYASIKSTTPNSIKPEKLVASIEKRGFSLVGNPIYKSDRQRYYFKFQKA